MEIHQRLVNRIMARAVAEGVPLTPIQIQQFESDGMSKEERKAFQKEFERENEWMEFFKRVVELMKNAIAEDAATDPGAPARYDAVVHELEDDDDSFTLWACCVPAIPGYKSNEGSQWPMLIVLIAVLAVIVYLLLRTMKII
jgi:hypothetical protein